MISLKNNKQIFEHLNKIIMLTMIFAIGLLGAIYSIIADADEDINQENENIITWSQNHTLTEDYVIHGDDILIIEPGTVVFFENGTSLIINGTLIANGTKENPINLIGKLDNSSIPSPESSIEFVNNTCNKSIINYAIISSIFIKIENSIKISNSLISNNSQIYVVYECSPVIYNNIFRDNGLGAPFEPWYFSPYDYREGQFWHMSFTETLKCLRGTTALISNNTFIHNGGFGLDIESSSPLIENNTFIGNRRGGISIQYGLWEYRNNPKIVGNLITKHGEPKIMSDPPPGEDVYPEIYNAVGVHISNADDIEAIFYNNKITDNDIGISIDWVKNEIKPEFNNDTITGNVIGVYSVGGCPIFRDCYLNNIIYDFWLEGESHIRAYNTTFDEDKLYLSPRSKLETENMIFYGMIGGLSITVVGAGILIITTEFGKYKFFGFIFPLYNKLKREKILDQFVRGQIYGLIRGHPGIHYSEIKRTLKVGNGTLAYHLSVLEKEEFIKSKRSNLRKLFYPTELPAKYKDLNERFPKGEVDEEGIKLSDVQEKIIAIIKENPGITQKDIVLKIKIPKQTVSYNIKRLALDEIINVEKHGNKTKCYPIG